MAVEGEIQFDAFRITGCGQHQVARVTGSRTGEHLYFPDINAGNIGYKIASPSGRIYGGRTCASGTETRRSTTLSRDVRRGSVQHVHRDGSAERSGRAGRGERGGSGSHRPHRSCHLHRSKKVKEIITDFYPQGCMWTGNHDRAAHDRVSCAAFFLEKRREEP